MSKIFKFKKWLSVPDAAKHLSITCDEEVTEADILRLALDGHLKLSIYLVNGARARRCEPVKLEDIEWVDLLSLDGETMIRHPRNGRILDTEKGIFQVLEHVTELESAVWDLPLIGGEILDVEHHYQVITGGPERTAVSLEGIFVASINGDLKEIQSRFEPNHIVTKERILLRSYNDQFHPAGALPEDGILVIRTDVLQEFERSINDAPIEAEKPLLTTERNTLLVMIAALCKKAGIDHQDRTAAAELMRLVDDIGVSLSDDTTRNVLKKIPDALSARIK